MSIEDIEPTSLFSSNISTAAYDKESRTLRIQFTTGAVYDYFKVSPDVYSGLMGAGSAGGYFAAYIKGIYQYEKVS